MNLKELNEHLEKYVEDVSNEYKHNLKVAEDAIRQILFPEVKQLVEKAKLNINDSCFIITFEPVKVYPRTFQNGEQIATEKENIEAIKKEIEISLKNTVEALKEQLPKCEIDTDITNSEVVIELSGKNLYTQIREALEDEDRQPGWVPEKAKNAIIDLYNKDKNHWLIDRITKGHKDVGSMVDFFDQLQEEGAFLTNDKQTLTKIRAELAKYGLVTFTKEVVAKKNTQIPGWMHGVRGDIIETRIFCL